jgi:hypothetical protein
MAVRFYELRDGWCGDCVIGQELLKWQIGGGFGAPVEGVRMNLIDGGSKVQVSEWHGRSSASNVVIDSARCVRCEGPVIEGRVVLDVTSHMPTVIVE